MRLKDRDRLAALMAPRSVAIVGASDRPEAVGGQLVRHLVRSGFTGPVYPVNPRHHLIQGLVCYPGVASLPEPPDLVAIAVPATEVVSVVNDLDPRTRVAIVLTSGFSETGTDGASRESELLRAADSVGVRLVGPNCQGVISTGNGLYVGFGSIFDGAPYATGDLALISQSGGFGFSALILAEQQDVHFGTAVSTGNEVDVSTPELIARLIEHGRPSLICAYIEALREPRDLLSVGRLARKHRVPVAVWKVGRSNAAQHAIAAHTGRLVGDDRLYDGLLRQAGMLSMNSAESMVDLARAFAPRRTSQGSRLGVIGISGGAGVVLCDHAEGAGLAVPPLRDSTKAALAGVLPAFASVENPVDMTAQVLNQPAMIRDALRAVAADDGIDIVCVLAASLRGNAADVLVQSLEETAQHSEKPVLVAWTAPTDECRRGQRRLERAGVACFPSPERLIAGAKGLAQFAAIAALPTTVERDNEGQHARLATAPAPEPVESEAYELLAAWQIPVAPWAVVDDMTTVEEAAAGLVFPLVAKGQVRGITHKSDAGLVRLNLGTADAVACAGLEIRNAAHSVEAASGDWSGLLLQHQVEDAVEVIVSAGRRPGFGPYVMAGMGGILTEILDDVVFRVPPLSEEDANSMLRQLRAHRIFAGARGRPPRDVAALRSILIRTGDLVLQQEEIAVVELNPVLIRAVGEGAYVADAVIEYQRFGSSGSKEDQ